MSKSLAYPITFVVCILLQLGISPAIAIAGCSPNFLVVPVLLVALKSGPSQAALSGFLLGLLTDFAGSGAVGGMALVLTLVGFAVGSIAGQMETESALPLVAIAVATSFFVEVVYGITVVFTDGEGAGTLVTLVTHGFPSALYSSFFGIVALITMNLVVFDTGQGGMFGGGARAGLSTRPSGKRATGKPSRAQKMSRSNSRLK